jgi:inosose dehydratase
MIKIANAPCSWGKLEFDLEGEVPDYVQVLNEIAETGYAGTELGDWGFMPTDPKKLSQEIHQRNLVLLGAFVPVFLKDPASHRGHRGRRAHRTFVGWGGGGLALDYPG